MRISSISVTDLVSGVSDGTGIGSAIFVSLETTGGSITGTVSVFATLELVPDIFCWRSQKISTTEMSLL